MPMKIKKKLWFDFALDVIGCQVVNNCWFKTKEKNCSESIYPPISIFFSMHSDLYLTPNRYKIKYCWINSVKASNTMQPNWNDRFWPPTQSAVQKSYNWTLVQDPVTNEVYRMTVTGPAILRVVAGSVGVFWTMCSATCVVLNCT